MTGFEQLGTEARDAAGADLDLRSTVELVELMNAEDSAVPAAVAAVAEREVCVPVGAEILTGSTRLKAGTAQKLVLNMISTISMIRLGKTYGNLMVDLVPSNEKLRARARSIVRDATGVSAEEAGEALARSGGEPKVAIVSLLNGLEPDEARRRLVDAGGVVRRAVEPGP